MRLIFVFFYALLTLTTFIQGKGTRPPNDFWCFSIKQPKRIDVIIETGSEFLAGTDDRISLLLRDNNGMVCTAGDLDNSGNDRERNSIDHYAICCPQDFAKANGSLSQLFFIRFWPPKGGRDNWLIENVEVRMENTVLLNYGFHAWNDPKKFALFGISKMAGSQSKNGPQSYSLVRV